MNFLSKVRVALGDVQLELAHVCFGCQARGDANTYNEAVNDLSKE